MIIYISDKKEFKKNHPELQNKIINKPKYAFEVRGHQRKLHNPNTLGKDRNGDYCVKSFTWVIPAIKCADKGEFRKKIQILNQH